MARVKVVCEGDNKTEVLVLSSDSMTRPRPFSDIVRNTEIIVVMNTPGIWSSATGFGLSFTARGIIARPPAATNGLSMFNLKPGIMDAPVSDAKADKGVDDVVLMDDDA